MNHYRSISFILLLVTTNTLATLDSRTKTTEHITTPAQWQCSAAPNSEDAKRRVTNNLLPSLVIDNETKAVSIEEHMAFHDGTPGLSVAVIKNGRVDWTDAWGEMQVNGGHIDCNSLFQAGSIAKPVTMLAAARMQQHKQLDFSQDIENYLSSYSLPPGKQSKANPVNFDNLFKHTAGITAGGYLGYESGQEIPTDVQILLGQEPANSKAIEVTQVPGAGLSYSGGGYTLAEVALQDIHSRPFADIMHDWLLAPANMIQADFNQNLPESVQGLIALGHGTNGVPVAGGWHIHPEQAAAGLWATPSDLATLLIELYLGYQDGTELFPKKMLRDLFAQQEHNHAYGFRLVGTGKQQFIVHYGATVGYRAGMTINLHTGNGAVFMANSDYAWHLGMDFFRAVAKQYNWPQFQQESAVLRKVANGYREQFIGNYLFSQWNSLVSVTVEDSQLFLGFPNGDKYKMLPIEGDQHAFAQTQTGTKIDFAKNGNEFELLLYGAKGIKQ